MDTLHKAEVSPLRPKGKVSWVGIGLMAMSFSGVALYLTLPFLPVSMEAKIRLVIVGSVISWLLFLLGMLLAGNEGYLYLKQLVRRRLQKF